MLVGKMLVDGSRALVLLDLMRGFEIFLLSLQLGQSEAGARVGSYKPHVAVGIAYSVINYHHTPYEELHPDLHILTVLLTSTSAIFIFTLKIHIHLNARLTFSPP